MHQPGYWINKIGNMANQIIQLLFFDYQNIRMILIIEIMVTDIFTKSKSIKLFEKLRVLLISHWVLN